MDTEPTEKEKNEGLGAVIGTVIIVVILIVGGIYFWKTELDSQKKWAVVQQQIKTENQQSAAILRSIEKQLSVPEPDYINGSK